MTSVASGPLVLVGLMSGTSADGISAVAVSFADGGDGSVRVELLASLNRNYAPAQRSRLLAAVEGGKLDMLARLDFELGEWLADAARDVISAARLQPADVLAIASHGHTLWHAPPAATWQIGESAVIAERTGIDVVSDFRVRDVAAGGQGAPLVAIADAHLFADATKPRALQNLGGIANVTVVPPRSGGEPVLAFDTGPGCAVIDGVTRQLAPSLPYDVDGALAAAGEPIEKVVTALLGDQYVEDARSGVAPGPKVRVIDALPAHKFFSAPPPKSTGRELFSAGYTSDLIARCRAERADARREDIIATAVALTAVSIALAYKRFVPASVNEVLLSGGGARNPTLVKWIRAALRTRTVRLFSEEFFDDEAKEAVAFAFLGWLHLAHRAGNVPSATGARGERILGKLTPA